MNRYAKSFKRGGKRYYRGKSGKAIPLASSPARYGEMAKDPNRRADVPSRYLSAEHRRQREMNARLNAPVGAGTDVTNRDVAREARVDANVRYGQAEQDLRMLQARQSARQQVVPQYMDLYRQQLAQAQQRTQMAYQAAQQQMAGLGQALGQGAPGLSHPESALREQQAAAVRQQGAGSLAALSAAQGANTDARFNSDIANVGLRLVEELTREAGRGRELDEKGQQLAREKGEFTSSQRSKLTESYRKSGLENLVFAADQTQAAAKLQADKQKSDSQVNQWGYTAAEWRSKSESERQAIIRRQKKDSRAPKGPREPKYGYDADEWDSMSVSERRQAKKKWEAGGEDGSGSKSGKPGKEPGSSLGARRNLLDRSALIKSIARKNGLKDREALKRATRRSRKGWYSPGIEQLKTAAALDLAYGNRINRGTLAALRDRGVFVTSTGEYWGGGNRNAS